MGGNSKGLLRPHSLFLATLHRVIDALAILAALELAIVLTARPLDGPTFGLASAWAIMIYLGIGNMTGLYGSWRTASLRSVSGDTLMVWTMTILALIVIAFLTKTSTVFSRVTTTTWFMLAPALLLLERVALRSILATMRSSGRNTRTLALVGKNPQAEQLRERIDASPWMGLRFVGYFDDRAVERELKSGGTTELLGRSDDLIAMAHEGKVDYVYITLPMRAERRIVEIVEALSDTTASVYYVPNFFIFDLLQGRMTELDGVPVLSLHETPFAGVDGWLKRAEDIVFGSFILAIIALPMLLISLVVKLTSPGPVLFKQRRYGLNGKTVEVWKFRSMSVCEDGDTIRQAGKGDARVTPFGAFLRRTSLDELPQFINVLQGSMSIVGPRPHAVAHNEQYRGLIRGYMLRHKIKPGITGLAQVNGWRGETDTIDKMEMRVKYDLAYLRTWTIWLDLKIIFMTIFKGFSSPNAY